MLLNRNITQKKPPLYYEISIIIKNRKVNNPYSYSKSHLKYMDALPSYQDISSRVSTELILTFKMIENHHNMFWKVWEHHKKYASEKKKTE